MKKTVIYFVLFLTFTYQSFAAESNPAKILVFSKTAGFRHASIEDGKTAILKLGKLNGFWVDTTENAATFSDNKLREYAAIVFLSTTGDVLNNKQQDAFERYIKAGGGFVGIHAATDTEFDWPWYGKLVGAYFVNHPKVQEAKFIIKDKKHPSTSFFRDSVWLHRDELYNFKSLNPDIKVLISVDETSYQGGSNGAFHPFSWYHNYDGGRSFYTSMGHTKECWTDHQFLAHLTGGIKYAIGKNKILRYK